MRKIFLLIPVLIIILTGCTLLFGPSVKPGLELAANGDHAGALVYYESLIHSGKTRGNIYRFAYEEAFRTSKYDQADGYYQSAIDAGFSADSMKTLAVSLWYDRAKTSMAREHWKTAKQANEYLQKIAPDLQPAKFCAHMLVGKKSFDSGSGKQLWDAIGEFGMATNYDENSGLPYLWMGRARYKNDRMNFDAALAEYKKALEKEPDGLFAGAARREMKKIQASRKKMKSFWGN